VLVTIDTLRADHVGAYGALRARTPTLDALATCGTRFADVSSPTPLTLPSHATLMTGLDPPRHGVRHNSIFRLADDIPTLAERLRAEGFATGAFVAALVLDRRYGLARGFDRYDDEMGARRSAAVGFAERRADAVVDAALGWLETAPARFFAWVHLYDPHASYAPPPGFAAAFPSSPYDGEIAFADSQVGRLLEGVRARFGPEGMLVVATSDHGESLGEHGEPTHSYGIYDATQRVPLLFCGPGVPAGRTVGAPVRLADVAPTVLSLAGAAPLGGADGADLRPLFAGEATPGRAGYLETLATRLDFGWSPLFGVKRDGWKYVKAPRPELYDLTNDPGELRNRVEEEPARAAELEALLAARLEGARPLQPGVSVSTEDRLRLETLGYVVPDAGALPADADRVGGPDPKDGIATHAAVSKANALLGAGRGAEALATLESVVDPGALVLAVRAKAALDAGDAAGAEADARAALTAQPSRGDVWNVLARAIHLQGRREEARAAYEQARAAQPESALPLVGLGELAEEAGDTEGAEALYEEGLRARGEASEAAWRLAALLLPRSRERADDLLAQLPTALLERPEVAIRVARAEARSGDRARARERLERAARATPEAGVVYAQLGSLLAESGEHEAARDNFERALALLPEAPQLWNDLAFTLAQLGRDLDRALDLARRAERAAPDSAVVLDTLASVHAARGEWQQSLAAAERGLRVAPPELVERLEALRTGAREHLASAGESS
jgi:arylsulfatase A-like enzyme/tetratricopeptide (TPR) repeat protein